MKVSWVTSGSTGISRVDYGRTPGLYDRYAEGTSESYSFLLYKSGQVHNVLLGPLEASTLYYYKCGGGGPEYSFKTPPPVGAEIPITFAIAGDLGQTEWTSATLNHIQQADYDVLILPGDLSYADYYQPLWDSFGQLVEPLASSRPWMVTQGNHEIERIPLLIDPFRAYNMRWSMPYKESGSDSNLYYSFEVSGSHILMLGSYAKFDRGSNQYKWLLADLAKVNRTATPWLIAVIHAPWYSSNSKHQGDGEQMRKSMELILKEANVDLVFAGHVHAYERTAKIFDWKADDCGVYHMTIGDGGNREGLARERGGYTLQIGTPEQDTDCCTEPTGPLPPRESQPAHCSYKRRKQMASGPSLRKWVKSELVCLVVPETGMENTVVESRPVDVDVLMGTSI
ncbi:hypothetical protein GOP47_0010199 [Adiantum capillus-veneris]|uniref:Purple acid phosphatase n=1 Tax=Adiantum capillus-veneris TaxID=13818 RepID=A0A9D4UVF2_ADICA|nr:hypothetical protein GOP47_0010199 [Adiantum capillus-veneris]